MPVIGFSVGGCLDDPEVAFIAYHCGLRSPKAVVNTTGPAVGQPEVIYASVSTTCRTIFFF